MSDYCHNKVIRMKVTPKKLGLDDIWDLEQIHKDLFDFKKNEPYMEIAPTEESFIDYVLSHTYGEECGEYGNVRRLYRKEVEEYLPIFKKIYPDCTERDLRYVDYCWYNCSEAPDYFESDELDESTSSIDEIVSKYEAGNEILKRIQKLVPQEYYFNKNGVKIYGAAPQSMVTIGQITDIIINYVEGKSN